MSIDVEVDRTHVDGVGAHRPNVSGDLPTVLAAAPMFRRAVAGYDRFQVESYVQWAEDELAAADRERERLLTRQLETVSALEEARELLAHSAGAGEFLRVSRRIGALLAAAADEAEELRGEAEALRREAEAERAAAAAERETATAEAGRIVADARRRAAATTTVADRSLEAARAEAAGMVERARATVAAAEQDAARCRAQAAEEAAHARLLAREEVLRILAAGREQRRRADAEAAAVRPSSLPGR